MSELNPSLSIVMMLTVTRKVKMKAAFVATITSLVASHVNTTLQLPSLSADEVVPPQQDSITIDGDIRTGRGNTRDREAIQLEAAKDERTDHTLKTVWALFDRGKDGEAVELIRSQADAGDARFQAFLGLLYKNGRGLPKSDDAAFRWFKASAHQNDPIGAFFLAASFELGEGVEKDLSNAFYWYLRAAFFGHPKAQFMVAVFCHHGKIEPANLDQAFFWYHKSAAQGFVHAQYNLGLCFLNGIGTEVSSEQAMLWLRKAAEQGDGRAWNTLGYVYEFHSPENGIERAISCYERAATRNVAHAKLNLGRIYDLGKGVPADASRARSYYLAAAKRGLTEAQVRYAAFLWHGEGGPPNRKEALKWVRKACEQNYSVTAFTLAEVLARGEEAGHDQVPAVALFRQIVLSRPADVEVLDILQASARGSVPYLKAALMEGQSANAAGHLQLTPLHVASWFGHEHVTKHLLQAGASPMAKDTFGVTPLHFAVLQGHLPVVRLLIDAGADPHIEASFNNKGIITPIDSPIHLACQSQYTDVAAFLLANGADINFESTRGDTPAEVLRRNQRLDDVLTIVAQLSDELSQSHIGDYLVALSACSMRGEIADVAGRLNSLEFASRSGDSPLTSAVRVNNVAVVEWLLQHGADPAFQPQEGKHPLTLALQNKNYVICRMLLNQMRQREVDHAVRSAFAVVMHGVRPETPPGKLQIIEWLDRQLLAYIDGLLDDALREHAEAKEELRRTYEAEEHARMAAAISTAPRIRAPTRFENPAAFYQRLGYSVGEPGQPMLASVRDGRFRFVVAENQPFDVQGDISSFPLFPQEQGAARLGAARLKALMAKQIAALCWSKESNIYQTTVARCEPFLAK